MAFRTLGAMRAELLARLGMGAQGASGGANLTLIDSFLRNGQAQLYELADWRHLTEYLDKTTGIGQSLYDYPPNAARNQRILRLERLVSGEYVQLREGISTAMWSTIATRGAPARYERYAQINVYPQADQAYTLRIWYVRDLGRFTQDNDPATLDDEMVFLHAIANAKAHYRQPDAQTYQSQLNTLLGQIRGRSYGSNGVYRRDDCNEEPERRPQVVGRDVP